jgi:hypothetical protein
MAEDYIRAAMAFILILWNWLIASHLETPYPPALVELYSIPLTRIFLLGLVLFSAHWCPTVGLLTGFAFVCLGADVIFFSQRNS